MLFTHKRKQKAFDTKYEIARTKTIRYMEKRKKECLVEIAISPTIIMQHGLTDDMKVALAINDSLFKEGKPRYDQENNEYYYSRADYR